jgi:aminopeptidase N
LEHVLTRTTWRTLTRATAIGAAAVLFLPTAAMAASPGAPGIGDPYFPLYGNGGYDASHYDVAVSFDGDLLTGTTTMTARAKQDLSRFNLDFVLNTTSVTVNGEKAKFSHDGDLHELEVTPAKALHKGDKMKVVVKYSDHPDDVVYNGFNPVYDTNPGAVIVGEPASAPWWMATNDHPRDKATFDIKITVPKGMEGITVGRFMGNDKTDAKTDTWHWSVNQPSTGYLVPLAVGQFKTRTSKVGGLPTFDAVAEDTGATGEFAMEDFKQLDKVEKFLIGQFGKYHFDAHGNVMPNASVGFALETQTRPFYSPQFWGSGHANIGVVVHEQAHQWFGDNVSVRNWRNVWLNEGFAQWSQWRWAEKEGGDTGAETLMGYYNSIAADNPFWQLAIGDPGPDSLFDQRVYTRGAMTVQALRNRLGEKDFLDTLQTWQKTHEYGNGTITQFRELAEKISGKNLKSFFKAWLYALEKPAKTKKNGLKGFDATVEAIMPSDLSNWDELQRATAEIAAAEAASYQH